jgi:hypothetical protein
MNRTTRLAAAFAFGAGLTAAGVALAQTQPESAPPAAVAQPAPPPPQPWAQSETPAIKPWRMDAGQPTYSVDRISQPTYSVDPPPDGASGIYLPAVVLGYAKSAAGCVVVGCEDGPQVGGAADSSSVGPPPAASAEPPPPAGPGPSDPR